MLFKHGAAIQRRVNRALSWEIPSDNSDARGLGTVFTYLIIRRHPRSQPFLCLHELRVKSSDVLEHHNLARIHRRCEATTACTECIVSWLTRHSTETMGRCDSEKREVMTVKQTERIRE